MAPKGVSRLLYRIFPLKLPPKRTFATSPSPRGGDSRARLRKLNDHLPSFLRSFTTPLFGAPIRHVTSFLVLHEITAILPLFGLVAAFHYGNWLPDLTSGSIGDTFDNGIERFGRWLRKKGWVEDADVDGAAAGGGLDGNTAANGLVDKERKGTRLVLEFATAYAITKALLPVRIAASVWATPWFARAILTPMGNVVRQILGRK